ncbi:putative ribonuclease H-like domain-containing protein [Tanacetum coccineum]|uniref:Ribonuclease H-like domain-containing protein n=1 Tax=Tanacetum coccineum TaxID=301880 RepID=A0ABQ4XZW2_9ASTR
MCDKKNKVLFTDSECLVLSPDFKLPDENQILLKLPDEHCSFRRFSWTFFLRTKDETSAILKDFIRQIENQLNQKVKTIRCDNGTEFKNRDVIEFCGLKGIKREYSNARTPQQNGVAERKNRTLIEAARTMLADSFLPNTFWAEAVSTACYVLNRVLVTKPHNKTPYELLTGKTPIISYIRPFGCHVTILNTIDHLGKFAGKSDEGFLVGYSLQSKAFRVYNLETKRVEENLHINFLENKPNVAGKGPNWLFDLDYLTDSMNYHSVRSENQANLHAGQQESNQNTGTKDKIDAGDSEKEDESHIDAGRFLKKIGESLNTGSFGKEKEANEEAGALRKKFEQETENLWPDFTNWKLCECSPITTLRFTSSHLPALILGKIQTSTVQTRSKVEYNSGAHAFVSYLVRPIELSKPLVKDEAASDVDFLHYRYLKGKPKLGLWYPSVSLFDLESYSDSDYAGANLTEIHNRRLSRFRWQETQLILAMQKVESIVLLHYKKQQYVAVAELLWAVYHSKTKHIAIRHHFKRDAYEKKLIQVLKIHIDDNVADLLTKAFDVSSEVPPIEQQRSNPLGTSPSTIIPDSIPETSGGNLGGHSSSDKSLSGNEGELTLQSIYDLCLSLCAQSIDLQISLEAKIGKKEILKETIVQGNPLFDEIPEDTVDHMEIENAQDVGRTREIVDEDKEIDENILSTEDGTDRANSSTDWQRKEELKADRTRKFPLKQRSEAHQEQTTYKESTGEIKMMTKLEACRKLKYSDNSKNQEVVKKYKLIYEKIKDVSDEDLFLLGLLISGESKEASSERMSEEDATKNQKEKTCMDKSDIISTLDEAVLSYELDREDLNAVYQLVDVDRYHSMRYLKGEHQIRYAGSFAKTTKANLDWDLLLKRCCCVARRRQSCAAWRIPLTVNVYPNPFQNLAQKRVTYLPKFGWSFHFDRQFGDDRPYSCPIEFPKPYEVL